MSTKKRFYFSLSLFLCLGVAIYLVFFTSNKVGEGIKKRTARVLVYEYIPMQTIAPEKTLGFSQKDSIYKNFRKNFRYHYQCMALASFADSSRILLISEPTPHFHIDSLQSVLAKFTHQIKIRTHKIGYDGFAKDVEILLVNATQENMDNINKKISKLLYYSDYKIPVIPLPIKENRKYYSEKNLDYQISLQEFNDWFLEQNEIFGDSLPLKNLLAQKKWGVYFSKQAGFVAWLLPRKQDISGQINNIRQFVLDGDIILGAIRDSTSLAIIARERESSLEEMPPLRIESILLLASISEKELSQSLDVNDLMAGKLPDGRDWCPTYLSKELENTEFGYLMTLTDVFLKDWSEKGTIKEVYYNYPEPSHYPFDKPLFRKLGLRELVYNWNTTNAMYAIDLPVYTIYTLNRTGALPVSYFNSQSSGVSIGSTYERQAYQYFATLNNTDLARVVQYTALYQLFIDNQISYGGNTYGVHPKNKPYLLLKPVKTLVENMKKLSSIQVSSIADSMAANRFEWYQKQQILKQIASYEASDAYRYTEEDKRTIFGQVQTENSRQIELNLRNLQQNLNALSENESTALCRYLAYPRGEQLTYSPALYARLTLARKIRQFAQEIGKSNLIYLGVNLKDVKDFYVANLANSSAPYLKTPSVIITFNDFLTTGGHNLSSRISRVNKMTAYKSSPTILKETPISVNEFPKSTKNPVVANPTNSKSSGKSSTGKIAVPTNASVFPKGNIRPRASVISTEKREKRGL